MQSASIYTHRNIIWLALLAAAVQIASCDKDPFTVSPEELAEQIRRNTPTELPPVTTVGANTMGAWIHPQPGSPLWEQAGRVDSFLFVASGVDRPETALAESLDCEAFNNYLKESNGWISTSGRYCRRPEIDDSREMILNFGLVHTDSVEQSFIYIRDKNSSGINYWTRNFQDNRIEYKILLDNRQISTLSGTFSGRLINRAPPHDTLCITLGRFDVTYGITP